MFQAAVQDTLNEQEGVPSLFNPPPPRPLQVNTADHRVYSYIVSRPQPRVSLEHVAFLIAVNKVDFTLATVKMLHFGGIIKQSNAQR